MICVRTTVRYCSGEAATAWDESVDYMMIDQCITSSPGFAIYADVGNQLLGCRGFNKRKAADTREDCGGISGENLGSDLSPQGPEAQWTAATTPPTDASRAHAATYPLRCLSAIRRPPYLLRRLSAAAALSPLSASRPRCAAYLPRSPYLLRRHVG